MKRLSAVLVVTVLAVSSTAYANGEQVWLYDEKVTMKGLLRQGYEVKTHAIGNSIYGPEGYYLLQKGADLYSCTVRRGDHLTASASCAVLIEPRKIEPPKAKP